MPTQAYDELPRTPANYVPLTPLSFLPRTAALYPDRTAIVHGDARLSWAQLQDRCCRLASALARRGIGRGDTVSVLTPNIPQALEAAFGVPMSGAVLNTINIRLDAATVAFILDHGEAKVLIVDREFGALARAALGQAHARPLIVDIDDPQRKTPGDAIGTIEYEDLLAEGDADQDWTMPADEWNAISLNYTSGTTGNPKGVVYHHRGAYLNAVGNILAWNLPHHPVYLWTVPHFHCNGWCFPWTVAAVAGTHVCLRQVGARPIYDALADHGVTHLGGAPIVMSMILNAAAAERRPFDQKVHMMTAASPPPASVIEGMEALGIDIIQVYGLTETYGPSVVCVWQEQWDGLPIAERAAHKARQGVTYPVQEGLMVADARTLEPVPSDGRTLGEVFIRGNATMKGYLKNPDATEKALAGGWFHSGDLGVRHPNGYIELKDRSKDIIISGGENISTIEVENILYRHEAVLEAAVVARPDEKWGETPCAFVTLRPGMTATDTDIMAFCRDRLAHYKCPRTVVFSDLPKTSTGKVQKFVLREQARAL